MVAVTGLGVQVEDDAVGLGGRAHLAVGVLSLATFPRCPAAPEQTNCGAGKNNQDQNGFKAS